MQADPGKLLKAADIKIPLIGFYDTPHKEPFAPFVKPEQCIFSCYNGWLQGRTTVLSEENVASIGCPGAGYWSCNIASAPREQVAHYLGEVEGLKASQNLMAELLTNQGPYQRENDFIIIGPLKADQYHHLKTVTFFVNPDQLSLLLTGAEYHNASVTDPPVMAKYGSGCGQMAALFNDFDTPKAFIGATDIAMRSYLPIEILAFTVTKPMFEMLCELDENSFLGKSFWQQLKQARLENDSVVEA